MTPRLETPRLVLRAFAPTDWEPYDTMLTDAETTRYMHFARWTENQRRQWFDSCVASSQQPDTGGINWAITRQESGNVIGWFGIGTESDASFGYLLDRASWNQGYITEALRAVLAYKFGTCGAEQVRATCDVDNPASARVMQKVGMRREKTVSDADFEGNWANRHHYAVTKAEYDAAGPKD